MNNDSFSNLPNGTSSTSTSTNNQLNFTLDQNLEGGLYLGPTQLHSLSLLLNGVYMPLLQTKQSSKLSSGVNGASKDTPHTAMVSYDFMNNLKKFSSQTYQTLTQLKGEVSLEIPQVDISDPKEASRDEQIVATIESKLEYWTQLIRSLLEQTIGRTREGDGPLSEIEFWRQRAAALGTFWEQLNDDAVKQMIEVLRHYDASQMLAGYEDQFQELTKMYMEAKDNVKFLETLERHFKNISRAQHSLLPISDTLPSMMRALRMVWVISRHYNTDKQMVPLLELIANEIADKVEDYLDFDKTVHLIFDQPEVVRSKLIEGKNVLRKWKKTYEKVKTEIENSERDTQWDFEPDPLFERTEYMHARCMDLIFIVDTIVKYKNFLGPEMEAGTGDKRGVEDVLKDVESLLVPIKKFPNVFDTKSEKRWKILMKEFKENVQEIEISINDFIDRSFVKIQSAEGAFKLLQDVKKIQSQDDDAIKHNMQLKSLHILDRFGLEVDQIKHIFDTEKDNPPRTKNLPPTAGSIYWSNSLFERIRTPILSISNDILDNNEKGKQIKDKCLVVANSIKEFEKNLFDSWKNNVTSAAMTYLKMNILDGDLSKLKGYVNFHPNLTLLIQESKYLDKLNKKVPELAQNVTLQEDKYHGYVENLKIMLDNFNSSVKSLEHAEYRILKPEIEKLMKTLQPGFTVLNWNSLGIEDFIKRCNKQIDNFQSIVTKVKRNTSIIRGLVNQIKNTVLVIDPRELKDRCLDLQQLYTILENHKNDQIAVVRKKYTTISQTLLKIEGDLISSNVIQDINENTDVTGRAPLIASYYEHWEKKIFRALTRMVLNSINRLSQFRKTPGIIRVSASLIHAEIVKTPDPEEVVKMMHKIMRSIIESTKCCIRWMSGTCVEITQIDIKKKDVKDDPKTIIENNFSFYTEISNMRNQVLTKARFAVVQGINRTLAKLHKLLEYYQKFSDYWKLPKEAAIQRFGEKKPSWEAFDERLEDCMKLIQDIQIHSKPIKDIHFIRVDISNLLRSIQEEARKWIDGFGRLLNTKIKPKLDALEKEIENYKEKLDADIQSINDLRNVLGVIDAIRNRSVDMERDYREVESCYNTLQIYNIEGVPNAEIRNASALSDKWERLLKKAAKRLKELEPEKEKFAEETKTNVLEFKKEIEALSKDFYSGPNNENTELSDGLKLMDRLRTRLTKVQETRDYLVRSEKLFELKITSYPVLVELERDMASVGKVYDLYREWKTLVDKWSKTLFEQIPIEEMKKQTKIFLGRLRKDFTKEIEDHHTHQNLRHLVDSFKKSIPLFENLKSDALRDRHWEELMEKTGVQFDPKIATLQNLIDMQLYKYEDQIDEIFSDAKKELKIEHLLRDVAEAWRNRKFEMKKHIRDGQDRGYILIGRDIIKEALEEDTTQLAGVSGSRHVAPFMAELSSWEKILSTIDEVIDLWWDVQNTWINLEVIFIGSQDIREQLQALAKEFDKLDSDWTKLMFDTSKNRLIKEACNVKGRRSLLEGLQQRLSACQKGLSAYLQTKRDAFPRFFYISDDELLSILGSSDPENVQTQIRKMFSNCGKLIFKQGGKVVLGMQSPEQEEFKFSSPVVAENVVEKWLTDVDVEMKDSLKQLTKAAVFHYPKSNRIGWIKENLGMVSLAGSQIWWTWEVEDAFRRVKDGDKTSVKDLSVKLTDQLNDLVDNVRTKLSSQERQKITTMIIIDVHARDIVDNLVRDSILDDRDFEWESQLRFYWDKSVDNCKIRQCSGEFDYGYEYMGLNGRLVITPLTDRCFMTLTQALTFNLGGSPAGPAGTGKTESVKDLAKSMALPVMVMNCGEGLDYKAMGRIFSGLCQNGAWGCFDEFNRIELPVLSVVSTQIRTIQAALRSHMTRFRFEDSDIRLDSKTGIFITMNPGYAGRVELPDNLKALFRPCTMVVPDLAIICEIMLFSEGFIEARVLARKMIKLYDLAKGQLSKQNHYDWGLRALKSILVVAGRLKRENPDKDEATLLMKALYDMNVAKFVFEDTPLFEDLLNDLFVSINIDRSSNPSLFKAIKADLKKHDYMLFDDDQQVNKVIQLYETMGTRHSVMVVGGTSGGKSVVINTLKRAQDKLGLPTKLYTLNPKAQTVNELYGVMDNDTREWIDGLLSNIFRRINVQSEKGEERRYVLFDGDVDAVWIENMNSVMDDNKVLTLPNGERIDLVTPQCSLLFEVGDLQYASPATVSRCGMVYVDPKNLPCESYFYRWKVRTFRDDEDKGAIFDKFFEHYVNRALDFVLEGVEPDGTISRPVNLILPVTRINMVTQLCTIVESLLPSLEKIREEKELECVFLFCLMWSVGGSVVDAERARFDKFVKTITNCKVVDNSGNSEAFIPAGSYPKAFTLYEYFYDSEHHQWKHWESVVPEYHAPEDGKFSSILVPTIDTERYSFLLKTVLSVDKPVLFVGEPGTAKTVIIQSYLNQVANDDPSKFANLNINFSSRTTSMDVQRTIEDNIEKRIGDTFGPLGGKRLRVFIDDLSMPKVDTYGTQQPIALLKLLVENGGLYERGSGDKLDWKKIVSLDYIAATAPPGGSNNQVDPRFISLFSCFNLTFPSPESLHSIYSSILMTHLSNFNEIVRGVGEKLTNMTLDLYNYIVQKLPPTPSKFHYVFNLRDLSRVYSGLCLSNTENFIESAQFLRLWRNETTRVFHDRLISPDDKKLVTDYIAGLIEKNCPEQKDAALANPMLFGDFLDVNEKMPVRLYQDLVDYSTVKKVVEEQLLLYNDTMERPMNLVMFDAAIEHLCRVHRIIRMDRGHALLVGVGGSGKQSLTRLAAFLAGFEVFTINICRGYGDTHFRDDLKMLYDKLGVENKKVVFLFTDAHVLDEGFLEYINNMLTTGMVPALFPDEEKDQKISAVSREVREAGMVENKENCWNYFISKCRDNLHIVLAMSPAGNALRVRCRNFPGLVSSTSIDWFLPWPSQALEAVADRFLQQVDIPEENREDIVQHMIKVHLSVGEYSRRFEQELRRYNYVTPKNYLDYIAMYKQMLDRNRKELDTKSDKLQKGLNMLKKAKDEVESMKQTLSETKIVVQNKTVQVNQLLVDISKSTAEAMSNRKTAQKKDEELSVQTAEIEKQKEAAEIELAEAEPILQAAEDALRDLNRDDITQMKSFANPHDFVKDVGKCIVILLGKGGMEPSWKNAKALMGDVSFIKKLINYDKNLLSQARVNQIKAIVKKNGSSFNPSDLKSKSSAAAGLLTWVDAIVKFFKVWKSVEPKRRMVEKAQKKLDKSMKDLAEIKATLSELEKNIQNLNEELAKRESEANELKEKADSMEKKLNKANKLIEGLGSERTRWAIEIEDLKQKRIRLVGDCLLGSGFMCYTGAFTVAFRNQLMKDIWFTDLQERNIPVTENFHLNNILTSEVQIAQWESEGLPSDEVSVQNGILTDRAHKFPLCIDPQLQAISWIKERERKNDLVIRTFNDADFMRELENAIKFGRPFLFENVDEFIDPMIEPVLDMNLLEGKGVIKLSGEEVEVDKGFRLYLCTRLSNPHYSPEIYGKTQIINYSVTFDGLQEQLLNGVVNHERPELEEERKRLVQETNSNKIELAKLEEKILHELSISGNTSLIENDDLIQTLDNTKSRVADIQVKLVKAQETSKEIEKAREAYRVVAKRGAILFFAMASLSGINSMYEYSLSSYSSDVYEFSLTKSEHSKMFDGRLQNIIDYLTFRAYTYTCNGLFEEHKLTFSMLITTKILEREGQMNMQQYDFFLKGNVSLDKLSQENPFDWISDQGWKDLLKLPTLEMLEGPNPFENIASDVIEHEKVWKAWYDVDDCENKPLPLNYDEKLSQFQKICLIKCFRVDRIMRAVTKFISAHMGERFVKPPVLDYQDIFNGSTNVSPIVCMISPGYDPASDIIKLAEKLNKRYKSISLGQGQGKKALDMLDKGMSKGHWVVLQNCHLLVKWMKNVEKILNSMEKDKVHKEFRLWLTTEVSPEFPLAILQRALKVVTEPPNSLQLNMATSFSKISEEQFNACPHPAFKPLVFVLAYFHAVIQERRKYGKIGWNVPYDFNRSDFDVSFSLLDTYLTKAYEYGDPVPWDSLKYLVGEAMYGGRVTDDFDRRILITYLNEYMGDFLFDTFQPFYFFEDEHRSYSLPQDCITKSLSLEDYKSHVEETILVDNTPEVFGLHPNAEIGYLTNSARSLFQNLLELQPRGGAATGSTSREDYIGQIARGIQEKIPQPFDRIALVKKIGKPSPIDVVLLQEVERWNILVTVMQQTLSDLQRALVGEIGMSAELENLSFSLFNGMVPSIWRKYAPKTRKTLSNWLLHFQQRYQQYDEWIETSSDPMVIWLSGLHVPESYLTALVQVTCKKYKWPLDRTTSIAKVTKFTNPNQIKQKPKDGCYVKGLFLEGADWDLKTCELKRQEPKKLVVELPIVLISPIENSKVKLQNTHTTPVYVTADRGSASGVGLVFTANLDTTDHTSHWILQSAAITLETDD
eukprot:CAMPEP_0117449454 /NCGR_PEP_ID=MMETSP0759-20121206/7954_1 /TAXON_ID=63605 /ORGANISM="Percolomonas cosmopolitus, Strain WS" /LENGTH=4456 /DNA_ID=CAMNT_0005241931 /DNA_START=311 /DNA_END=13681 /DNA_ORIENTATION=-